MKKNTKIIIIVVVAIAVLLYIGASIFSIYKFRVYNPVSACFGMMEILFTGKEYAVVQEFPYRVVFSKAYTTSGNTSRDLFEEYMNKRGFACIPESNMAETYTYTNGTIQERVSLSVNGYYGKWIWE